MSIYIGNNNVAKKVKGMYVGIDNVARKVKKGYVGVDGVARQFYSTGIPTTSTVFFALDTSFTEGVKEFTGVATEPLKDGSTPTLKITTELDGGFVWANNIASGRTGVLAYTNANKYTVAKLNENLLRTEYNSKHYNYFGNITEESVSGKTFIFDFKTPRKVTLHCYTRYLTLALLGSLDGVNWSSSLGNIGVGSEIVVTTTYRYYKLVPVADGAEGVSYHGGMLHYLYFDNVDDTIPDG